MDNLVDLLIGNININIKNKRNRTCCTYIFDK